MTTADDPTRCPRCDFSLMIRDDDGPGVGALTLAADENAFSGSARVVYCDRCGWSRPATERDLSALDRLQSQ